MCKTIRAAKQHFSRRPNDMVLLYSSLMVIFCNCCEKAKKIWMARKESEKKKTYFRRKYFCRTSTRNTWMFSLFWLSARQCNRWQRLSKYFHCQNLIGQFCYVIWMMSDSVEKHICVKILTSWKECILSCWLFVCFFSDT